MNYDRRTATKVAPFTIDEGRIRKWIEAAARKKVKGFVLFGEYPNFRLRVNFEDGEHRPLVLKATLTTKNNALVLQFDLSHERNARF